MSGCSEKLRELHYFLNGPRTYMASFPKLLKSMGLRIKERSLITQSIIFFIFALHLGLQYRKPSR